MNLTMYSPGINPWNKYSPVPIPCDVKSENVTFPLLGITVDRVWLVSPVFTSFQIYSYLVPSTPSPLDFSLNSTSCTLTPFIPVSPSSRFPFPTIALFTSSVLLSSQTVPFIVLTFWRFNVILMFGALSVSSSNLEVSISRKLPGVESVSGIPAISPLTNSAIACVFPKFGATAFIP